MRKLALYAGAVVIVIVFVAAFVAYFVSALDVTTQQLADGFGRPLSESPLFMRLVLGQDQLWAGWTWFLVDLVVFWGGIAIGYLLIGYGLKDEKSLGRDA